MHQQAPNLTASKPRKSFMPDPKKSILFVPIGEVDSSDFDPATVFKATTGPLPRAASTVLAKLPATKLPRLGNSYDSVTKVIHRQFPLADANVKDELARAELNAYVLDRELKETKTRLDEVSDLQISLRKLKDLLREALEQEEKEHHQTRVATVAFIKTIIKHAGRKKAFGKKVQRRIEKSARAGCEMSRFLRSEKTKTTLWRAFYAYKRESLGPGLVKKCAEPSNKPDDTDEDPVHAKAPDYADDEAYWTMETANSPSSPKDAMPDSAAHEDSGIELF